MVGAGRRAGVRAAGLPVELEVRGVVRVERLPVEQLHRHAGHPVPGRVADANDLWRADRDFMIYDEF